MELLESGGLMMWPLAVISMGIVYLSIGAGLRIRSRVDPGLVEARLHAILFWGAMALVLGLLGTVVGVVQITQAVALAGEVEATLMWAGFGIALVTLIFGMLIFLLASLSWYGLRRFHLAGSGATGRVAI